MISFSNSKFSKINYILLFIALIYFSQLWSSWDLQTIDNSLHGADGVRFSKQDGNQIKLLTGWEESGFTCLYSKNNDSNDIWKKEIIGKTPNVEDAIFIHYNKKQELMIMSFCEGETISIFLHMKDFQLGRWTQQILNTPPSNEQWMTGEGELFVDGKSYVIAGGKNNSKIYAFQKPEVNNDNLKWYELSEVSWTMSIIIEDIDEDGDNDILFTDRNGKNRGCWWLENPNNLSDVIKWSKHRIGSEQTSEYMFADTSDINGDGLKDIIIVTNESPYSTFKIWQSASIRLYLKKDNSGKHWEQKLLRFPAFTGSAKGVKCGDIDNDGMDDIVVTCENAFKGRVGVFAIMNENMHFKEVEYVSGPNGIKFDQIQLLDIDSDGDMEILTTEEWDNLGLIYYDNPYINN